MRLFAGAQLRAGLPGWSLRNMSQHAAARVKAKERPPRIIVNNNQPPRWESGELKVLKPQYRLHARKLRFAVDLAESLGYVVLRPKTPIVPAVYPPPFKKEKKKYNRAVKRKAKIAKGLEGMDKRRDAMHKKDRDDRYAAKLKGINKYFPERRAAPLPKGNTHYKKRRAIGNG